MSIAQVQKVQVVAHSGVKMGILSALQEEGLVQVEKTDFEGLGLNSPSVDVYQLEHNLYRLSHALDYLTRWEETGFTKKLFAPKTQMEREKRKEVLGFDYLSVLNEVEKIEAERNDLLSELRFLKRELEFLDPFKSLELPLGLLKPTETTQVLIGSLLVSRKEGLEKMSEEEGLWYDVVSRDKR